MANLYFDLEKRKKTGLLLELHESTDIAIVDFAKQRIESLSERIFVTTQKIHFN